MRYAYPPYTSEPIKTFAAAHWLEDDQVALNDPTVRAYLMQGTGLNEGELPVSSKPQRFRITEVDDVYIITSEDAPPERR